MCSHTWDTSHRVLDVVEAVVAQVSETTSNDMYGRVFFGWSVSEISHMQKICAANFQDALDNDEMRGKFE